MKPLLAGALALIAFPLVAQTSTTTTTTAATSGSAAAPQPGGAAPSPSAMMDQVMSVLTPDEKTHLMNTRTKTMADSPDLQKEEMDLMQKGMAFQSGSATESDKNAFRTEVRTHADKVRAAMIKDDPTIEPILLKVEAQIQKLRAQYQSAH